MRLRSLTVGTLTPLEHSRAHSRRLRFANGGCVCRVRTQQSNGSTSTETHLNSNTQEVTAVATYLRLVVVSLLLVALSLVTDRPTTAGIT